MKTGKSIGFSLSAVVRGSSCNTLHVQHTEDVTDVTDECIDPLSTSKCPKFIIIIARRVRRGAMFNDNNNNTA